MVWRIFTVIFVAATAGILGTWVADRTPPTEIISHKVVTPQVAPGGELKIAYYVFRQRSCQTTYQRTYRDGGKPPTRYILEDIEIKSSPAGVGHDAYTSAIPISVKATRGIGSFRPIIVYACNPIHYFWPIVQTPGNVDFEISGEPISNSIETIPRR